MEISSRFIVAKIAGYLTLNCTTGSDVRHEWPDRKEHETPALHKRASVNRGCKGVGGPGVEAVGRFGLSYGSIVVYGWWGRDQMSAKLDPRSRGPAVRGVIERKRMRQYITCPRGLRER